MSIIRPLPTILAALALLLAGVWTGPAAGLTDATLVDPQLQATLIKLNGLQNGTISYFDADRRLQQRPAEQFVMLRGIGGPADVAAGPTLVLVDGQRLAGRWLGVSGDGQQLRWEHPVLGELSAALETLQGVRFTADLPEPQSADAVLLSNGDALVGFIDALGEDSVHLLPTGTSDAVPLPIDRIAAIRLANPAEPMPDTVQTVVLRDGSRLYARDLRIGGERVAFDASLPGREAIAVDLPLEEIHRVELTAGGYRLLDISELPRQVLGGGETFGFARPPRLIDQDLLLHAPVRLAIRLPEGAQRFAATAVLDLTGVPADRHDWASCQLIVQGDDQAPLTPAQQIDARHATVPLNVPVSAGRLILELDPSVNGPILDRVRLTDAVLLLRQPAPAGY